MMRHLCACIVTLAMISAALAQDSSAQHGPAPTAAATRPSARLNRSGSIEEKYDDGKLKSEYSVDAKGIKRGSYALYSEDGKRTERGSYRNGELDGVRQTFYANGTEKLREYYRNGKLNGSVVENDESGNPVRAAQFNQGIPVVDRTQVNGVMVYPRSIAIISADLARIGKAKIETVSAPEPIPPHEGGNDSQANREDAVRRLMQYRYLCYIPYENMKLDPVYCAHDEAACGILSVIGKLNHTPANPGWPQDQYKYAYIGTSNSNLDQDSSGGPLCVSAVNGFMDDSDSSNIDRIGHRRWCLNPPMGKVGFASFKHFAAMWSMDTSRKVVPDYDFVAYPSPGLFPNSYFDAGAAWSISLNEAHYRKPSADSVKVTLTPARIDLAKNKLLPAGDPAELNYKGVNLVGFGISNCIIFRPKGASTKPGSGYLVEVTGLRALNGAPASIRYYVEFFKPESKGPAAHSAQGS